MTKQLLCSILLASLYAEHATQIAGALTSPIIINATSHPCNRPCEKDAPAMTCRYTFKVEHYQTLSKACFDCPHNRDDCKRPHCITGDGNRRIVTVVNRQLPGPSIEVCRGDKIVVDVENLLLGESTSIHWHGQHHQATPYMDGVPFVTQCPIQPSNTFRYAFRAEQAGTHFWHSHTGVQRADGVFGALVVRRPEEQDPHSSLYDFDLPSHVTIVFDWLRESGIEKFVSEHHGDKSAEPSALLINGFGRFAQVDGNANTTHTPPKRFVVREGYRYRFRVISAMFFMCAVEVSIDNHTLTVISGDGNDFVPVKVDSLVTYSGERFDFVVNANRAPGLYWIRFRGLLNCDERFKSSHQVAVLQYEGASDVDYPEENVDYKMRKLEVQLNTPHVRSDGTNSLSIADLQSLDPTDPSLKKDADFQFYISYDLKRIDRPDFHKPGLYGIHEVREARKQSLTPHFNHISMKLLPQPLMPARDVIDSSTFCNRTTRTNCERTYCECPHVLQVPLNSVVELIIIDEGFVLDASHPIHLHGYSFRVVAMDRVYYYVTEETIRKLDKDGMIKRNLVDPPIKDTVAIPDGGYVVLRFYADNPGYWLLHCHVDFHTQLGMALVFKVGENEEMPPVPPNFPQCGNYLPEMDDSTNNFHRD